MTHLSSIHNPRRFKLVKEVRVERGDHLVDHTYMFKMVKEVRVDRGDASLNCPHPIKCKVSNPTRDERGDTSASWPWR